jgi:hypothetical protein
VERQAHRTKIRAQEQHDPDDGERREREQPPPGVSIGDAWSAAMPERAASPPQTRTSMLRWSRYTGTQRSLELRASGTHRACSWPEGA